MKYRAIATVLTLVMLLSAFSFTVASATELVDTSSKFTDVANGKWYKSAVDYAVTHGLFSGMSETTFEPDTPMSRAMFVTVLSRIENIVVLNNVSTKFSDVPLGKWYTGAVRWASDNGIVYGITDTEFVPDASITREQMCTMLIRYANYKSITLGKNLQKQAFSDDATIAGWAKDAVYSCQQAGIVSGMSPTTFVPKATATRAQVARILYVFHDEYINIESQPPEQETPPEELPFRPEYSYGSGILVSKERQPNRSVLPSFDIDKTGFVKGGTKLSYLNGVTLHFFTSDLCALWSYRDDNGKWISEWDWFKSLKDEIGLEIKYTVKAHANSINSSLQYMTAGKQLDVICTSEQTLASALCISRPLDELINITDYGSSPAISYNIMNAYKWGGSRRAVSPIGDVEVLWYNQ
ncbi:MAG: S-layer homology domain-containing protein, partial [Clostridia bacterium]|nr:S-layer homology domain-containing protein [Clostridia bacterium]